MWQVDLHWLSGAHQTPLSLPTSLPSPPDWHREWGLRSVHHICACCAFLLTLPLLQGGAPPKGESPSQTAPNFFTTCSAWVLPTGCSTSGTGCSSMGPPRGHQPCQQTCSSVGSSLHGSTGPGRSLLQHGLPMGSQPPLGIPLHWHGAFHSCRWVCASPWTSMGCRGTACLTMVCSMGCRGISAPVPGEPPPPPSSLTRVSAELFHIFSRASPGCCSAAGFYVFLNMLSQRHYQYC